MPLKNKKNSHSTTREKDNTGIQKNTNRLLKNTMIRHYQIIELLGEGGMGKVYKAKDRKIKRLVALKTLNLNRNHDKKYVERFSREAMAIAKLQHPNIIKLYEIGIQDDVRFFTMEYIPGETLHEAGIHQKLRVSKIVTIMIKISHAIHYAHTQKIIHRDLKPANIILDEKKEPFVMDFGLVKISKEDNELTKTGEVMGTVYYMSPEQAMGKSKDLDHRTDIYSLGIILYELLTGEVPFNKGSTIQILNQIINNKPRLPTTINTRIPKALQAICLTAMHKKPEKRYKDAKALAEDLERFQRKEKVHARYPYFFEKIHISIRLLMISLVFIIVGYFIERTFKQSDTIVIPVEKIVIDVSYTEKLIAQGFNQEAYKILNQLLKNNKESDRVHLQLVFATVNLKKYDETLHYYQKLNPKEKLKKNTLLAIAKVYYYRENYDISQGILQEIANKESLMPKIKAETKYYLGLIFYETKKYLKAIAYYEEVEALLQKHKSISQNIEKLILFKNLGHSYLHKKKYLLAEHYLKKALFLLPNNSSTHEALGKCFLEKNSPLYDLKKAKKYFEKCIELYSKNSKYYSLLGKTLERLGKYREANDMYIKSLNINMENFDATRGLLSVPLREIAVTEINMLLLTYYLGKIQKIIPPDLLKNKIKTVIRKYQGSYIHYMAVQKKQKNSPEYFFSRLEKFSIPMEVYKSIQKGLLSLRYHSEMKKIAKKYMQKVFTNDLIYRRIKQTWEMIQQVKKQEQKFVAYYYIAHIYLQKETSMQELKRNISADILHKILKNKNEESIHRYLAAKAILMLLDFEFLQKNIINSDPNVALLCQVVLKEAHFPIIIDVTNKSFWKNDLFLCKILAKNIDHCSDDTLLFFQKHNNDITRILFAANIIAKKNIKKKDLFLVRKTMADFTKKNDVNIKSFAHHSLWGSYILHKDKLSYEKELISGLRDKSAIVKKSILRYQKLFSNSELWKELAFLLRNSPESTVLRMAIPALVIHNENHPVFDEIIFNHKKYPYSTRSLVFMSRLFIIGENEQNRKFKIAMKFSRALGNLKILSKDPQPEFRFIVYCFLAIAGLQPLDFLKTEKNTYVRSNIIANMKFMLMSNNKQSYERELKLLKPYLSSKHLNIKKSAVLAFTSFSTISQEEFIFKRTKAKKMYIREGVAIGFYSKIRLPILKKMDWEGRLTPKYIDEHYINYIKTLKSIFPNSGVRKYFLRLLSFAIILYPEADYYYERSLIFVHEKKYQKAIKDLKDALQMKPKRIRYIYSLANVYYKIKNHAKAKEWLKKLPPTNSVYTMFIAQLYFDLGMYLEAKKVYSKLCLSFPNKEVYSGLAKCYSKLHKPKLEQIHKEYAKK